MSCWWHSAEEVPQGGSSYDGGKTFGYLVLLPPCSNRNQVLETLHVLRGPGELCLLHSGAGATGTHTNQKGRLFFSNVSPWSSSDKAWFVLLFDKEKGFPGGASGKEPFYQCRRHGNPPQYSWLENPLDRGAWRAMVHRVAKSPTQQLNSSSNRYQSLGPYYVLNTWVCYF